MFVGRHVSLEKGNVGRRDRLENILSVLLGRRELSADKLQGDLVLDAGDGYVFRGLYAELDDVCAVECQPMREHAVGACQLALGHAAIALVLDVGQC